MIINVVRGFSLVMHDPEGSHYKIRRWKVCNLVRGVRLPRPGKSGLAMTKSIVPGEESFDGGK
jgi:hypothetical protein